MAQLMPLPLTVSCFSKIQIGLPFWYRFTRVVPEKGTLNGCVCVCVCAWVYLAGLFVPEDGRWRIACNLAAHGHSLTDADDFVLRRHDERRLSCRYRHYTNSDTSTITTNHYMYFFINVWQYILHPVAEWLVASVLDSGAEGPGFKSHSRRCRITVLGKLFTPTVPLFTKQQNW